MIVTLEGVIRQRAHKAGYHVAKSGSTQSDYTLLKDGYVVISPVSIEEIDKFLSGREHGKAVQL